MEKRIQKLIDTLTDEIKFYQKHLFVTDREDERKELKQQIADLRKEIRQLLFRLDRLQK